LRSTASLYRASHGRPPALLTRRPRSSQRSDIPGVEWVKTAPGITLLKRSANEGMDFAAHNSTMAYLAAASPSRLWAYSFYVFLNSSVKGPFTPKYYPFHWATPYTSKLTDKVKVVSSSIVCLPEIDAGDGRG